MKDPQDIPECEHHSPSGECCPECRALVDVYGNCRCVIEEDPPSLESLVREVMFWHADPESPNYNECDKSPCEWCSNASGLLATPCGEVGGEKRVSALAKWLLHL